MLEKDIEQYGIRQVAKLGGKSYKWQSINNRAVPDRLHFFPFGILKIVEYKAPGKDATPLQKKVHKGLRNLNHEVLLIDTKEKVDIMIKMVKEEINELKRNF